ncbi:hypothetical protein E8P82_05020 [Arthrobacter echini]|uniref:Uncharacterized protein n=1 Tax=Arthrobacter echini TaxID=1529066 RepID=A0A4V3Z5S3_9MICC|nr:hypothetical protein [Arthrobacter echini]THJ67459.1 hypothetical protein E8P82_05020 [Arthrobacter echini]
MSTYNSSAAPGPKGLPPVPPVEPPVPPHEPPSDPAVGEAKSRSVRRAVGPARLARIILGTLLAVLLIVTWVSGTRSADEVGSAEDWAVDLASASTVNDLNNAEAQGAPQQAVVSGWYANELAVIQAEQNTHLALRTTTNGTLLLLLGLGIAGEVIIRGAERVRRPRTAPLRSGPPS